jgi:hypothetical protein
MDGLVLRTELVDADRGVLIAVGPLDVEARIF